MEVEDIVVAEEEALEEGTEGVDHMTTHTLGHVLLMKLLV